MYYILAILYAALGVFALFAPRTGIILFSIVLLAVPSSAVFDVWTYRNGLYVYDFFFIVLLLCYPLVLIQRIPRAIVRDGLLLAFTFLVSLTATVLMGYDFDKYVIRDLRPFLLVVEGLLTIIFLQQQKVRLSDRNVLWIGLVAGISPFIGFGLVMSGLFEVTDVFYQANSYRHIAIGSFSSAVILIWLAGNAKRTFAEAPLLSTLVALAGTGAVILAGMRMLVVATILACAIAGRIRPQRIILAAFIALVLIGGFAYVSVEAEVTRVTESASIQGLSAQLANRFGPAIEKIEGMKWWHWIVGTGMGTTFYIPWFAYRGLDTQHNAVDSMYLTLGIKFGIMSLVYLWLVARSFGIDQLPGAMGRAVLAFVAVNGLTMAVPYQKYTIGITVLCAVISCVTLRFERQPRGFEGEIQGNYLSGIQLRSTSIPRASA